MVTPFISSSPEETERYASRVAETFSGGERLFLSGSLGAGKTVFVRGVARGLGIEGPIQSPSFTILIEYEGRFPFFHFDLYRISSIEEFELLGADHAFTHHSVCAVEWSAHALEALPSPTHTIHIDIDDDGSRIITVRTEAP